MALGTPALAVADVEAVLTLRPLHLPSLVARAQLREANGQYRQARGDCLKGLRLCRSLPPTVAGVLQGEAALAATLEQARQGGRLAEKWRKGPS
jgi:ATP/maltotriose-dependent transcriptional regulator MalT